MLSILMNEIGTGLWKVVERNEDKGKNRSPNSVQLIYIINHKSYTQIVRRLKKKFKN
jgi:hypothetical protein